MKARQMIRTFAAISILLLFLAPASFAFDTGTHERVNAKISSGNVNSFSLDEYLKEHLGIEGGIEAEFGNEEVWQWIQLGGEYEDAPQLGPPYIRSFNHFHDPLTEKGFKGSRSSVLWSQMPRGQQSPGGWYSWHDARWYFYQALTYPYKYKRDDYYKETFRGLGQLMHLVQDVSVPAHVRDDMHVAGFHYEKWLKANPERLDVTPFSIDKSILRSSSNPSAPVPIASIFDTNQYNGMNPEITLTDAIGLAEYTNANFFSMSTIFDNDYPHPSKEDTNADLVEQQARDGRVDKVWYIKKKDSSKRLASYSYFLSEFGKYFSEKKWLYNLDSFVFADYASELVPRAVGYSTALLEYFFRGDIDLKKAENSPGEYIILNNSNEDMDGVFELYKERLDGNRVLIWSGNFTLGPANSANNKSMPFRADMPSGNYMLVFKGTMGNEQGAVAARFIENMSDTGVFLVTYLEDQQYFSVDIANGKYKIDPVEEYKANIVGSNGTYSTWTVTSTPDHTKHYVTHPRSEYIATYGWYFDYMMTDDIKNYGVFKEYHFPYNIYYRNEVRHDYTLMGTDKVWLPSSDASSGDYQLVTSPYRRFEQSDGDFKLYALGRHNYSLDKNGNPVTVFDSIWQTPRESCTSKYVYRYKTSLDPSAPFHDGDVVTRDRSYCWPIWTWNFIVAALGKGKSMYVNFYFDGLTDYTDISFMVGDDELVHMTPNMAYYHLFPAIEVLDYDNMDGDDSFIILYRIIHFPSEVPDSTEHKAIAKYFIAYKMPNSGVNKRLIYEEELDDAMHEFSRFLYAFSTQMSQELMAYTFIEKRYVGSDNTSVDGRKATDYVFSKRVVGLINISDGRLPRGYTQEFIFDSSDGSYDYSLPAGIGIHKLNKIGN